MKKLVLFLLLFSCISDSNGQGRFYLRAGGGLIYYNGDLNDRILTHPNLVKPALTVAAGIYFLNRVSVGLHYFKGKLLGDDAYAVGNGYKIRNLSFQSKINDVSLLLEVNLFPYQSKKIINPFIAGGIGAFTFSPEAERDGLVVKLQPLGTEGQFIVGGDSPKPYKLSQLVVPVAIGFYVRLYKPLRLRFEISNHFTFTDYLDDVSKNYPDSTALAATPNGATAILFSSKRKDGKFQKEGTSRGNNFANDSYTTVTLTLVYNPWIGKLDGKKKRKGELDKCFGF